RAVIAVMHTTMIRASMTAYSTAVGPSSRFRKLTTFSANLRMYVSLSIRTFWNPDRPCPEAPGRGLFRTRNRKARLPMRRAVTLRRLRRGADGVADGGEGLVGVGAQGGDGGDAHHDDQGKHDRVLNGRRAVLALQEAHHRLKPVLHGYTPF